LFPSVCFVLLRHCHCLSSSSFDQPFHSFFLSVTPFLVDCWLPLGPSIFGLPLCWLPPLCKPIPRRWPRRCSHSSASASAVLPFLGVGLGGAPIPRRRPQRCSHSLASASAVLPFLGLGSAPIPRRRPWQCSHSLALASPLVVPRRRPSRCSHSSVSASAVLPSSSVPLRRLCGPHLGAPHETFGPASVLCTEPSASPWWCSSSAPCLRLSAPHETFGLASAVLLLGSSASLLSVRFGLIVECHVISKNTK
jgi:hypothetical protein